MYVWSPIWFDINKTGLINWNYLRSISLMHFWDDFILQLSSVWQRDPLQETVLIFWRKDTFNGNEWRPGPLLLLYIFNKPLNGVMEEYLVRTIWLGFIDPFLWSVEVVTDGYFCLALPHCVGTMSRWHTDLCLGGLTWKEKSRRVRCWFVRSLLNSSSGTTCWFCASVTIYSIICICGDECAWLRPDDMCCRATEEQLWQIIPVHAYLVGLQPFCVKRNQTAVY